MALTIATGFVVDDAIVMIENIARHIEQGDTPLAAAMKGSQRDRLHHHFADHLADRGADPAAVHGRCGGTGVPRVRHHPGGVDPDFGGGVADADADDVRALLKHVPEEKQGRFYHASGQFFDRLIARYGKMLNWVLDRQKLTLWWLSARCC